MNKNQANLQMDLVDQHSLQIESQEKNEKKWKNFSQGIVCTTNRPPRSAGLCREREAVRNQIRPPRPLHPPSVKEKRLPSRSRSLLSEIYINSYTSIPTISGDQDLYYVGQWLVEKGKTIYVNNNEPLHRIIPYNAIWHGHTSKSETEKRFRAHHPTAPTYRAVISSANRTQTLSCN